MMEILSNDVRRGGGGMGNNGIPGMYRIYMLHVYMHNDIPQKLRGIIKLLGFGGNFMLIDSD